MTLTDLTPALQLAIGPVILISGVGLLLLSLTNTFGRIVASSRRLASERAAAAGDNADRVRVQLEVLAWRARLVRSAIALAALSSLLAALLILALFLGTLLRVEVAGAVAALFTQCLLALIASLVLFIFDVNVSLRALWLESGLSESRE